MNTTINAIHPANPALILALFMVFSCGNASAAGDRACPVLYLDTAIRLALKNNPGLKRARAKYQAALDLPSQAGSLPDPVLSLGALNVPTDSFSLRQEPMTQMQIKLTQAVPFPGKLALKREALEKEAEAAGYAVEEERLRLIRDVKKTWWDTFFLEKSIEIVRKNQRILQELVVAARMKYQVGRGLQQDVLLAQVELSNLLNMETGLKGTLNIEKASLIRLLGRPPGTCFSLPRDTKAILPMIPGEKVLLKMARDHRPLLAMQKKRVQGAGARLRLAQKGILPDFTIGAAYGYRQGRNPAGSRRSNFASLMVSLNIPIWAKSKQLQQVAQKSQELAGYDFSYMDTLQKVQAEISGQYAYYKSAMGQALFYRDTVIPQAKQTLSAMLKGYQVNKVDFLNVVRSRLALLDYEKRYWRMFTNGQKGLAGLEAAIGTGDFMKVNQGQ